MIEGFKTSAVITVKRGNIINLVRATGYCTMTNGEVEIQDYTLVSIPCDISRQDQLRVVDALMTAAYRKGCRL